ncbi:unnamed protein product, partial [marine sediment metagenome]
MNNIYKAKMSTVDFNNLSNFIFTEYGIKMPKEKKIMLQGRLLKRLRALNMTKFSDYVDYVFSEEGQENEVIHMIDVVSTNKTDFFREAVHFDFLNQQILPEYVENYSFGKQMKIWSAGCSSGEEPYTIAITLYEFKKNHPAFDFHIHGTDVSSRILESAALAIYKEDTIEKIPVKIKKKYFLRSKNRDNKTVRVIKQLRDKVSFSLLNFMDNNYYVQKTFDVIFCRNVLIYFELETQESVINKLCRYLKDGGYFFLGHSETIIDKKVPLKQL